MRIRVLTILCALTLSLAFALPVTAQLSCPSICQGTNTATGIESLHSNTTGSNSTATGAGALLSNTTGDNNTATGFQALFTNTTGSSDTAIGAFALFRNTTGDSNTAMGMEALLSNTTGNSNTAMGAFALDHNTTGNSNTAMGMEALNQNTTGDNNTALGFHALARNTGSNNIAIGHGAGFFLTTGNHNIHIGNAGNDADIQRIRIGTQGIHIAASIAGIFGARVLGNGVPVEVNSNGQLGTVLSSRRAKDDIRDMNDASAGLGKLRPVTFRYKAEPVSGSRPIEYGLIAEEVAEIYPDLVVLDKDGQPAGVRYHVLPAMLLNEVQRQQRVIEAQQRELDALRSQARLIDELTARLLRLEAKGAAAAGR